MHRCDEGRAIKSQGVLLTSHGTHETRPGLVGSQPGLVDVWMVTQVILGMKRSADVGFVDLSSLLFECNSPSFVSRDKCLLFSLLITPASPRTPHIPWAPHLHNFPSVPQTSTQTQNPHTWVYICFPLPGHWTHIHSLDVSVGHLPRDACLVLPAQGVFSLCSFLPESLLCSQ